MPYIKRDLYEKIKKHLNQKEITFIIGPRQVGKTTLIKLLENELKAKGEKTLFFNLDIENDFKLFESQEKFLFALKQRVGNNKAYIFIDEFQRKENANLFIKGIYDMNLPYKFIITGSGSIDLKAKIHESLTGRKKTFLLSPLSFEEFFNYRTNYEFKNKQDTFLKLYPEKMHLLLKEYLTFGGYPRVVIAETLEEKYEVLKEIYESYILKDISLLLPVQRTLKFKTLVEALAALEGNLVNISELSKDIGVSIPTIEKYLWYLENTFIIRSCYPFSKNPLKEITRSKIYYFYDIGLKNLILGKLTDPLLRKERELGFDFQTFVFNELNHKLSLKETLFSLNFWRTKNGAEVDIILKKPFKTIGIETKYSEFKKARYTRAMRSFIKKYKPARFFIVNKNFSYSEKIENVGIEFIPFTQLDKIIDVFMKD